MKVNIIFDSRRQEKYDPLINELKNQGIANYTIWPCLIYPSVVKSINASHKMIVKNAKDNGEPECVLMEDDCYFPAADGWKYFLDNKPEDYDLYLAATYVVTKPLKHICGFHLYCVHEKFYEKFLSVPDESHIDTVMDSVKGDFVFCYPFAALQRPGFSANNKSVVNYNLILKKEDIYGG